METGCQCNPVSIVKDSGNHSVCGQQKNNKLVNISLQRTRGTGYAQVMHRYCWLFDTLILQYQANHGLTSGSRHRYHVLESI